MVEVCGELVVINESVKGVVDCVCRIELVFLVKGIVNKLNIIIIGVVV